MGPSWGPTGPRESPKNAPGGPQECSKRAPRGPPQVTKTTRMRVQLIRRLLGRSWSRAGRHSWTTWAGRRHVDPVAWAIGGAPQWGNKACERMTKWAGRRPVGPASGAVGAAPRGATKRVKRIPKYAGRRPGKPAAGTFFWWSCLWGHEMFEGVSMWPGRRHVDLAAGTSDEFLMGTRNV